MDLDRLKGRLASIQSMDKNESKGTGKYPDSIATFKPKYVEGNENEYKIFKAGEDESYIFPVIQVKYPKKAGGTYWKCFMLDGDEVAKVIKSKSYKFHEDGDEENRNMLKIKPLALAPVIDLNSREAKYLNLTKTTNEQFMNGLMELVMESVDPYAELAPSLRINATPTPTGKGLQGDLKFSRGDYKLEQEDYDEFKIKVELLPEPKSLFVGGLYGILTMDNIEEELNKIFPNNE